jgi:phosphatidylglycerophosphate synthase
MLRQHLPNVLSISRIGMALMILVAAGNLDAAMFKFLVVVTSLALVTDWADGYLARRWNVCSEAGYVLDAMGDRAIHLSLTLIVLVRYRLPPVFVWLLIFRDILIYAVRVLNADWLRKSRRIQWISRLHATLLRVWLCSYFLKDGTRLFAGADWFDTFAFSLFQTLLLSFTITLSYWGIAKSLRWHETDPAVTTTAPV